MLITSDKDVRRQLMALRGSEYRGSRVLSSYPRVPQPLASQWIARWKRAHPSTTPVESADISKGLWAVINNAGINSVGPVEIVTMQMFQRCAEVNLFGPIRVTKSVLPLIRQAQGRVINVTSERAFNPRAQSAPYCLAKSGLTIFSDCLSREMSEFKVKVITVVPGEFAGATSIVKPEIAEGLQDRLLQAQASLSLQDQQAVLYSKDNIETMVKSFQGAMELSGTSCEPVIQAYIDAVLNADPLSCYLVHGFKRQCLDPYILLVRCRPFVPECLMHTVEKILFFLLK
ncbi:D-beta-hydroxybutyrate dehydrogenase, mitochondrial [Elysia marginata]|uniref:D-beta-hydroxybutyrate dehydrogenase, mitochondrial n=1 Tax=Elysia marginata TaxID=1093978 RepID=A0AAV4F1E9_9GAST|nr:D-beta-hydroxybutyrate dehydrogenase, mitochondrial [Elysia marginata]